VIATLGDVVMIVFAAALVAVLLRDPMWMGWSDRCPPGNRRRNARIFTVGWRSAKPDTGEPAARRSHRAGRGGIGR
jgi:hypothetical protein